MARRGENIHKRKDGRWEGRYIKARTSEGKIQWGYVYGTVYAEVKRVLIQKKAEAGFYNLKRTDLTFEALAEVWLHSLQNSIKESTYAHYSYTLHKYLLPILSKVPVASLDENFLERITLDELSFIFGTNRSSLCKDFKRATGKSLNDYVTEKKLSLAKKMLTESDFTVTEIAEKLNFTGIHYFTAFFKKNEGLSPMEYRAKRKE